MDDGYPGDGRSRYEETVRLRDRQAPRRRGGLLEGESWFYTRSITAKSSVLVACLLVFGLFRNPWVQAANAVVLAIICGQLGFQLHDAGAGPQDLDEAEENR